jgi:hypothetical protein
MKNNLNQMLKMEMAHFVELTANPLERPGSDSFAVIVDPPMAQLVLSSSRGSSLIAYAPAHSLIHSMASSKS